METPESGGKPKRKMKTPYQLEVLEQAYAVNMYPAEEVRAELSEKLGLNDRQLQMWFCHRRLKTKKEAKKEEEEDEVLPMMLPPPPPPPLPSPPQAMVIESEFAFGRKVRKEGKRKRLYETPVVLAPTPPVGRGVQLSPAEMRVISSVEEQLGEALREDGPILGVEFDPLPPGAFGAPIVIPTPHQKQSIRSYSVKLYEHLEPKAVKASAFMPRMEHSYMPSSSSGKRKAALVDAHAVHPQVGLRAPHEYQFLPQKPNIQSDTCERMPQSHFYDSASTPNNKGSSLPAGGHYLNVKVAVTPTYTFQGRQQISYSGSAEYENTPNSSSFRDSETDAQLGMNQVIAAENLHNSSERMLSHDEDPSRIGRKRKSEEVRIQKEVEAHEKRIRKELEKQDILRRKREEQMKKEMERLDRERRKEEERMLREKQREEERLLREQRREIERREKYLQKETLRVERMKQKEEQRREREALKLKAANERATARKVAREYMEFIEDERLELMELAATSKGLSSIITLDSETLQQLDMFRDMLSAFPPKSVQLRRPFSDLPWTKLEDNIGNFLMVWGFLSTFLEILGLWAFNMDEFLQSLHDYDSKLLGQIHVALLKIIIKDIEDVARIPSVTVGAIQNSSANPGGGHPQIVEGAYDWGFDICSWKRHLNVLTWPEILRQFAVSAGFGPKLKNKTVERSYFRDDDEGNDCDNVISSLQSGVAAKNAVALMHERGYSNRRRSRHRLTPGTVKFAAFHVLSLEGSNGLTILEVAERIQKSGLRDLTTSKTPEASIAAALSRDTRLFEKTAPSTYCLRSPFRKDPADADALLSAAREKIHIFQNGHSDSEEAEKDADEAEDAEPDEDSECDGADDLEVEGASTDTKLNKNAVKAFRPSSSLCMEKSEVLCEDRVTSENYLMSVNKSSAPILRKSHLTSVSTAPSIISSLDCQGMINADVDDTKIDESNVGETWVQGLLEGDYSDLSIEERLNALVALIGVAMEGNSLRGILEERLEAANSLKKKMWADVQLDKRRIKEEYASKVQHPSFTGCRAEASQTNAAAEGSQTPLSEEIMDTKYGDGNSIAVNNEQVFDPQYQNNIDLPAERSLVVQDFPGNPDSVSAQQYGYAVEKSRSQLKSSIGHKAELYHVYRFLPLGQDRRHNRYWMFSTTTSPNDPGSGRIFFESKDGLWRLIDTEEVFDALLVALDTRGVRESQLHFMLQSIESIFKEAVRRNRKHNKSAVSDEHNVKLETGAHNMTSSPDCHTGIDSPGSTLCGLTSDSLECSASFKIEFGMSEKEIYALTKRYEIFAGWMWKEGYNPSVLCAMKYGKRRCSELLEICHLCYHCYLAEERHCPSCHKTFKAMPNVEAVFSEHMSQCVGQQEPDWNNQVSKFSIGFQLIKAQTSLIEASIPGAALQPIWTDGYRKSWGVKLHSSTSAHDLLQLVTLLESAVKRDCLSSNFETTNELLSSSAPGVVVNNTVLSGSIPVLPWVADSTAAVGLRLLDLDASISYVMHQNMEPYKEKEAGDIIKLQSRFDVSKNIHELEQNENFHQDDYQRERRWLDPGSGRRGRGRGTTRGRGGRGRSRGGRLPRGIGGTSYTREADAQEGIVGSYQKRKYTRRGGQTRGRGRNRGRRSVRPRQSSQGRVGFTKEALLGSFADVNARVNIHKKQESSEESSPRSCRDNDWRLEEMKTDYVEEDNGGSESDENGQFSGDEYDDEAANYVVGYNQNTGRGMLDDEIDEDEDEDVDGDEEEEEDDGARIQHRMMDVDVDDEFEEEDGDEDGESIGGDANGEDIGDVNRDDDDFSSEYSDSD